MNTSDQEHWVKQLDQITHSYRQSFSLLKSEQLNWKPNAVTWSIGQIIEHVIQVNESYYPIFEKLHAGNYKVGWMGKLPFMVNFFGKFILKSVLPETKKKVQTFPIWEPVQSEVEEDIVERFAAHQKRLGEEMSRCVPLLKEGVVVASPANANVVYKLGKAFDIMIAHERRHLLQAQDILAHQKSS